MSLKVYTKDILTAVNQSLEHFFICSCYDYFIVDTAADAIFFSSSFSLKLLYIFFLLQHPHTIPEILMYIQSQVTQNLKR